jgi:hypothetical protein
LTKGRKVAKLKPWGGVKDDLLLQEKKGCGFQESSEGGAEKREERSSYSITHGRGLETAHAPKEVAKFVSFC